MPETVRAGEAGQAHRVKYDDDQAVIRLVGGVSSESIIWLCDEIDLAIDYYSYRRVDIQIDSPGGEIAALEYFMTRLGAWREIEGLVLGTLALTRAASAAAMILSLGTMGHRRAYRTAKLLYHDSRIVTEGQTVWTHSSMTRHREALRETDRRMTRALAEHALAGREPGAPLAVRSLKPAVPSGDPEFEEVEVATVEELEAVYAVLNARDVFITPDDAAAMHLIDRIEP